MKSPNLELPTLGITKNYNNLFLSLLFTLLSLTGFSQQPANSCVTNAGEAGETGLKTWCWEDSDIEVNADGDGGWVDEAHTIKLNVECDINSVSIVGDQLRFYIDPINPTADCGRDYNMRAEIRTAPWAVAHVAGTEEWFGWSYTFGNTYIPDVESESLFFQIKNEIVGQSPAVELMLANENQYGVSNGGEIVVRLPVIDDNVATGITPVAGQKLDIVVHVVYDDEANGLFQVWINGVNVYDKQVRTVYATHPWGGNAKWGIYKWPWANGVNVTASANNGITDVETFMSGLKIITRDPTDPEYLDDSYSVVDPSVIPADVTGVTVSPATATINIPETITLTSTIEPANASNQSGVWSSNNTSIASVDSNGVVTSVSEGVAIITYNSNDGGFSDSATIIVTNIPIGVESVSLSPETLDLNINATDVIVATVLPANTSDQTGVWTSSNPEVATVNQQGLVQPIAIGQTTITFTTNDGGFSDTSVVTVNNDSFGDYEFYNADTDLLIQVVEGGEVFDLDNIGENVNFRIIPLGGDSNPDVESVGIQWNGIENGTYGENAPLYAGMTGHIGNDYDPYTVTEGTYNFTVTYYSGNNQSGNVVAADSFALSFTRAAQANQVIASEDSAICSGDTAALIASGAVSYLWSTGETSETIAVTPNVTTTYTVTGTHSDGGTTEDSVTVTVNETPTVDAGADQSTCEGESVVLTATTTAGSITWSNGATTASITVNPADTTTYSVTVDNNGCVATDDVTVTVNSLPIANAGNDITIINGESATLTASGGSTYVWSTGETTNSIVVNPTVDTTYNVSVTSAAGCVSGDSVVVTVVENIVADAGADVSICDGDVTTLTASGGVNYLWSTGETTQSISVNPIETTNYSVTVSNQDQSASDTDSVIVTVFDLPIADAGNDITIVNGESTTLTASGGSVYNWSTGETTSSIVVNPTSDTTYTVNVSNAAGCTNEDSVNVIVVEAIVANAGEDVSICLGESTTLAASGGFSYQWSTGETTQSISVNPTETTNYSVTVSNQDQSASDTDSVTVTVFDLPIADAGNDITIVNGESTTLTASGGSVYNWSTGETTSSIVVNPTSDTTYTVSVSNAAGCTTEDSVNVIVVEAIVAYAGEDVSICASESTTLNATGGYSYLWSTGETTPSITVNPENTTDYSVTASDNFTSDTDSVLVTVNPVPVVDAGNDVTINQGENVTLYASGGNSYLWSTGDTNANISVSPSETTTYIVTTTINGCSDNDEVTVTVINLVQASAGDDQSICLGEEAILIANGGDSYEWSNGETTASITVSPDSDTIYTVTVTNQNGSDSDDVSVLINDDCPAMDFEFISYPNPTNGNLNTRISGLNSAATIVVSDILGNILMQYEIQSNNQTTNLKINLNAMSKGMYFVTLYADNRTVTKKIIRK